MLNASIKVMQRFKNGFNNDVTMEMRQTHKETNTMFKLQSIRKKITLKAMKNTNDESENSK